MVSVILFSFVVVGFLWIYDELSLEGIIERGKDVYGPEYFGVLDQCTRTARIVEGEVVARPGSKCWVLEVSSQEANALGFPVDSVGGQTVSRGVPGVLFVPSRATEWDRLSKARIIAHEAKHLEDYLLGYPQQDELGLEVRAWHVSAELFLSRLDVYGMNEADLRAGNCPETVPFSDCTLGAMLLEKDEEGFREIIAKAYLLP